ncbi:MULTISPECIES: AMP-binding protein [Nitrosomonas]|uniref:AMP-binding protein n=1 Tax=Nitrosomonas TaxID=914 RepID=UPI000AB8320D|nr:MULTISPECIES: AMP-binding protein [Nitrosomonas]UVS61647.1 AMP-binding protein [Nitrosomonas sp. PLL12]
MRHWRQLPVGDEVVLPEVIPADAAALFYTSGTTGRPKGVPLTHANIAFSLHDLFQTRVTLTDDRLLLPLPLHHVFPFICGMLLPLALGLTIVLPHALTGPQIVRAMQQSQATVMVGVPRLYETHSTVRLMRVCMPRAKLLIPFFTACFRYLFTCVVYLAGAWGNGCSEHCISALRPRYG